jgi:transcription antitermination protein NusB
MNAGRRKSREFAMQALFAMDIAKEEYEYIINDFIISFLNTTNAPEYFLMITKGVSDSIDEIDSIIIKFSINWKLNRISCVDRNILRIAVFEMLFCSDIPNKVAINEAIEIAKKYGTSESGAFINGVLDSINKSVENGELNINKV